MFVKASAFVTDNMNAYIKNCPFAVHYDSVKFYSTGPRDQILAGTETSTGNGYVVQYVYAILRPVAQFYFLTSKSVFLWGSKLYEFKEL
jgi:hypothetical protein